MAEAAELTFESEQWKKVLKRINTKWDDIKKRGEFGGIVAIAAFKDIREHFINGEGPGNKPWEQRKEPYKSWAEKQGKNKILIFSGRLAGSLVPENPKFRTNSSGVLLFSNIPYAATHDEGLDGMPERKFMWISNKAISSIIDQTLKWLNEE